MTMKGSKHREQKYLKSSFDVRPYLAKNGKFPPVFNIKTKPESERFGNHAVHHVQIPEAE
ncbi:hypothetical protein DAPPUDRAFT_336738 [Daphnia pulex]|uniref:Uncharacterized protein n=1 Tax=Daphnia pulex TaxID=6669 RepID=E9I084_DAPPU|nr:hypothetical protein DAPPUDRAFT_336738 [Daphnia pulex]|eukprot:EFX62596.1 hypothetical protein DAPPUDRAFT_336738 [Daphnia pulex]